VISEDGIRRNALEVLQRNDVDFKKLIANFPKLLKHNAVGNRVEIEAKYSIFLDKQIKDINAFRRENMRIPESFDYWRVPQLSNEEKEKLSLARPPTLSAASKISGVTPTSLIVIMHLLKRKERENLGLNTKEFNKLFS